MYYCGVNCNTGMCGCVIVELVLAWGCLKELWSVGGFGQIDWSAILWKTVKFVHCFGRIGKLALL